MRAMEKMFRAAVSALGAEAKQPGGVAAYPAEQGRAERETGTGRAWSGVPKKSNNNLPCFHEPSGFADSGM